MEKMHCLYNFTIHNLHFTFTLPFYPQFLFFFVTTTGIIVTVAVLDSEFLKVVEAACFSVVTRGIVFV